MDPYNPDTDRSPNLPARDLDQLRIRLMLEMTSACARDLLDQPECAHDYLAGYQDCLRVVNGWIEDCQGR